MPEYIKEEYDMDYTVNVSAYKAVADSLKSLAGDFESHGDSFRNPWNYHIKSFDSYEFGIVF